MTGAAAIAFVLAAVTTSHAAGGPAAPRIVVVQEPQFLPGEALVDTAGHVEATLVPDVGLNGGVAISPSGTLVAEVGTLTAVPQIPGHRFPRLPQSTFTLAPLMDSVVIPSAGGAFAFFISRDKSGNLDNPRGRPSWAPGGLRVVCAFAAHGRTELRIVAVHRGAPGKVRTITRGPGSDLDPTWSPNGRWIVYEHADGTSTVLMAVRPDGTDAHVLVGWAGRARYPSFDPTGRFVVFASDVSGRFQLYVLPAQGGPGLRLTSDAGDDTHASWSPDGRWIAYSGTADGDDEVYLVDPRGGTPRQLTHNATQDLVAGWQTTNPIAAPVVHLVSLHVTPTGAVARYTVSSSAPVVRVDGTAEASSGFASSDAGALPGYVDPRSRGLKTLRFPDIASLLDDVPGAKRVRVCIRATDPWGHAGAESCRFASVASG